MEKDFSIQWYEKACLMDALMNVVFLRPRIDTAEADDAVISILCL